MSTVLVVGAGGDIAKALLNQLRSTYSELNIISVTSQYLKEPENTRFIQSDYSEDSIKNICSQLIRRKVHISHVFILNGVLSNEFNQPEKRIEALSKSSLSYFIERNAIVPMLWIKNLLPVIKGCPSCVITIFSARVGSIGDNEMGGWYSYRASKSVLNMLVKTAAIEYGRRAKNVKFLLFHPGTVKTKLSGKFLSSRYSNKIFTPEQASQKLLKIVDSVEWDKNIKYLDWEGKQIPW
jgi:NAD(P)-dependent dehydrogenase (short-subunit alcohol dehydrogenase family)